MPTGKQRYVSNELTHFVGRSYPRELKKQYATLKNILTSSIINVRKRYEDKGTVTHVPQIPIFTRSDPQLFIYDIKLPFGRAINELAFKMSCACFCDIPPQDFGIHVGKYGYFGLAFSKDFLIAKQANPVYYICKSAPQKYWDNKALKGLYNRFWKSFQDLEHIIEKEAFPEEKREETAWLCLFLQWFFWAYVKPFDKAEDEEAEENFYMEREWRVPGSVQFEIDDVIRVILHSTYIDRFKEDFPQFRGQITFSDTAGYKK